MIKVNVITKARGFWIDMFNYKFKNIKFNYNQEKLYEIPSNKRVAIAKLVNWRVFDFLGLFLVINGNKTEADCNFSYNRFLKSDIPYVIGLENPTALVHYSDTRMRSLVSKIRLKRYLKDRNLKNIVCLSKACYKTLDKYYDLPQNLKICQIYPFVNENESINRDYIIDKSNSSILKCLYISSDFELKGGDDILKCFNQLYKKGFKKLELTIVTNLQNLKKDRAEIINLNPLINIKDFNLNKKELYSLYKDTNILLNPTRMDSFSLVTLESMKNGCCIVGSDIYAIKEMVEDGYNGYLAQPKYKFWDENNMVNHYVKINQKKTIRSSYTDENMVSFLEEKIICLYNNKKLLERLSLNSYERATKGEFSSEYIANKWAEIFELMESKNDRYNNFKL